MGRNAAARGSVPVVKAKGAVWVGSEEGCRWGRRTAGNRAGRGGWCRAAATLATLAARCQCTCQYASRSRFASCYCLPQGYRDAQVGWMEVPYCSALQLAAAAAGRNSSGGSEGGVDADPHGLDSGHGGAGGGVRGRGLNAPRRQTRGLGGRGRGKGGGGGGGGMEGTGRWCMSDSRGWQVGRIQPREGQSNRRRTWRLEAKADPREGVAWRQHGCVGCAVWRWRVAVRAAGGFGGRARGPAVTCSVQSARPSVHPEYPFLAFCCTGWSPGGYRGASPRPAAAAGRWRRGGRRAGHMAGGGGGWRRQR